LWLCFVKLNGTEKYVGHSSSSSCFSLRKHYIEGDSSSVIRKKYETYSVGSIRSSWSWGLRFYAQRPRSQHENNLSVAMDAGSFNLVESCNEDYFFWDVTPSSLVDIYHCFRETCLYLQSHSYFLPWRWKKHVLWSTHK
jgi:hypothetical protein